MRASDDVAGTTARVGFGLSGFFLVIVGIWIYTAFRGLLSLSGSLLLACPGVLIIFWSSRREINTRQANLLALCAHFSALMTFYFLSTRYLNIVYSTDSMIATYMGVVKLLHLQDPYLFSIKPFLERFGLPPSFYTPRVDGSYEFHLNYPAGNFLFLVPFYLLGLHDLRDITLVFHLMTLLIVFLIVPVRLRGLALAPLAVYIPFAVAGSLTDSVWAFLLLLSTVAWYKSRRLSFGLLGFAGADKQLAFLALPVLLIRNYRETETGSFRNTLKMLGVAMIAFWLPNLPFLLVSPGDWWEGVVSPYMPGTTPQIMGGIGLSELMTSIGLNPPASIFFLLMGVSLTFSLFIYAKRFDRLRNYAYILPIFVLFFYYRVFPNYLFFWLVPFIPDLLRDRQVSLLGMKPAIPKMSIPSFKLPVGLPRFLQGGMIPSLMLGLVLTTAFAGASGAVISRNSDFRVVVRVNNVGDPDQLGAGTLIRLTLINIGTAPITPRFFLKFSIQPFLWNDLNRTLVLPSASTGNYTIAPADPVAAIPDNAQFHVWVFDSVTGNLAGQSPGEILRLPIVRVLNPDFKWWTLDMSVGVQLPYGWKVGFGGTSLVDSRIDGLNQSLRSGVKMTLNYTNIQTGRSSLALYREIPGNVSLVSIALERDFSKNGLFGAYLTDGNHLLYIVFSDAVDRQMVHRYDENTSVVLPLQTASLTRENLDLRTLWLSETWTIPTAWTLGFFVRADTPGLYSAQVSQVQQVSSGSGRDQ